MNNITIGLLLPSSTIFPISKNFEQGLKDGLKQYGNANLEVELIKEFIGQGDTRLVDKVCNKFFKYDDAHLVTGILSNKSVSDIAPKFKSQQTPLLVNNLGAAVPDVSQMNDYVFINSPQLWRHAYTMGHWGVKTFGKKGMFIGSVYDAGYSFSHLLQTGMQAADAESTWAFCIPPMPPAGGLSNMDVIFPYMEQYQPDFIFAAFCGEETTLFLNALIKHGWHRKTKITGTPYLLTPFAPLTDDVTIYTARLFNDDAGITPENIFYKQGFQTGQAIAAAAAESNGAGLKEQLSKSTTLFNIASGVKADTQLTIVQNDIRAGKTDFTSKNVSCWDTYPLAVEQLKPLTSQLNSGWYNPYLCI